MKSPQPIHRPGLDVLALEIERQSELNSGLLEHIERLNSRIAELERIIESYQNSPSGTNNVVLL